VDEIVEAQGSGDSLVQVIESITASPSTAISARRNAATGMGDPRKGERLNEAVR
jgi:hypothetical protein